MDVKIKNVFYPVRNMDRAVRFYSEALGLKAKFRDGEKWTQFHAGDGYLSLASLDEAGVAEGAVAILEVENADAVAEIVTRAGATLLSRRDMGSHGLTVAFKDTEGNVLQLFSRKAA
jgi:predicted enzyme related to lactoylglutathione lyase